MRRKDIVNNNLSRIGQLVNIDRNEIITIVKTKKYALITAAFVVFVMTVARVGGPIPLKYGCVSVQDFSWPWRLF